MITWKSILRGASTRFAAGVGAFFGGSFLLAAWIKGITIGPAQVVGFTALWLSLTAGYAMTLGLLRPALQPDADVEGRRSFIAGLGSTCVFLGLGILHSGPTPPIVAIPLAVLAGGITTLATFFPWLLGNGIMIQMSSPSSRTRR